MESSVLFGYALHWLPVTGEAEMDRVQRKCGRMLLGFSQARRRLCYWSWVGLGGLPGWVLRKFACSGAL